MNTNDELEEGEIPDYEPLTRPEATTSGSSSKPYLGVSDSDSDIDVSSRFKNNRGNDNTNGSDCKRKRSNLWTKNIEESQLTDQLKNWCTSIDDKIDTSRASESYYEKPAEEESSTSHSNLKRSYEKSNVKSRLGPRVEESSSAEDKYPRFLSSLRVTAEDTVEDVAQDIVNKLCEEKGELVVRVVEVLGQEKAISIYEQTKQLEINGGMMILDGSRRRTPGGVFLQLIKKSNMVSSMQLKRIFHPQMLHPRRRAKTRPKSRPRGLHDTTEDPTTDILDSFNEETGDDEILLF